MIAGGMPALDVLRRRGGNTAPAARKRLFDQLVARLRTDTAADAPQFYRSICAHARDEFIAGLVPQMQQAGEDSWHEEPSWTRRAELSTLYETSVEYRTEESESECKRQSRELDICAEELAAMERLVEELAREEAAL